MSKKKVFDAVSQEVTDKLVLNTVQDAFTALVVK